MKKRNIFAFLTFFLLGFFVAPLSGFSEDFAWYVSASGNDENLGTDEDEAFKTLTKAIRAATRSHLVKTIIVFGMLNYESEGNLYSDSVFLFDETGSAEIVVKGAVKGGKKAVLSAESSEKRVITIRGLSKVRFENIEITGGISYAGAGVHIRGFDATVTFAQKCIISNNSVTESGGGIFMEGGAVSILGATISDNFAGKSGGGIYINAGVVTVKSGAVSKNTAKDGGGIYLAGRGRVSAENVGIRSNRAQKLQGKGGYGGGVFIEPTSDNTLRPQAFLLKSGDISLNIADGLGGGVFAETDDLFFDMGDNVTENVAKDLSSQQEQPKRSESSPETNTLRDYSEPTDYPRDLFSESGDYPSDSSVNSFSESINSPPDSSVNSFSAPMNSPIDPSMNSFSAPMNSPIDPSMNSFSAPMNSPMDPSMNSFPAPMNAPMDPSMNSFSAPMNAPTAPSMNSFSAPMNAPTAPSMNSFSAPMDSPRDLFIDESSMIPLWIPQINDTLDAQNGISA